MLKVMILLSAACLGLVAFAESKSISKEEIMSQPCTVNCPILEAQPRSRRQAAGIIDAVGGLVSNIIHESLVHSKRGGPGAGRRTSITSIGNGNNNSNEINYNYYFNNNRRNKKVDYYDDY